ncbi:hypothetical protein PCH_Pc12g01480 [Penicillium rubens Wisconsin 54-1255]|uniref:Uncharacterized protein n=1 Tax=Penicillium rubens (strain ATCC 28089 / DSM 1075 / NRRL 1951 / Wisconsin 54-1255) TaxID=500485 RepID=B6GYT4_PENRW|nr:hypothetical protein PCH_Pc12g01480 [Penicillium rubens Wisconsin 54-1255]
MTLDNEDDPAAPSQASSDNAPPISAFTVNAENDVCSWWSAPTATGTATNVLKPRLNPLCPRNEIPLEISNLGKSCESKHGLCDIQHVPNQSRVAKYYANADWTETQKKVVSILKKWRLQMLAVDIVMDRPVYQAAWGS